MNRLAVAAVVAALLCVALVDAAGFKRREAWNKANAPKTMNTKYEAGYSKLPLKGALPKLPWSDTYWPSYKGGIANRWNGNGDGFKYDISGGKSHYTKLSEADLKKLSPAEKFDLYRGLYDMPTVKQERERTQPTCPTWEGICHGWAPASLLYDEPNPVVMTNKDGVKVPFGSSDIKALLSYYLGVEVEKIADTPFDPLHTSFMGERCDDDFNSDPSAETKPECRDVNAGSFHIILANQIAMKKVGFVGDLTRDAEVWNQPVNAYESTVDEESTQVYSTAASGTVRIVNVTTVLHYAQEVYPQWTKVGSNQNKRKYTYSLELDANNNIIGGEWGDSPYEDVESDRPDFLWAVQRPEFMGEWAPLKTLYEAATSNSVEADNLEESNGQPNNNLSTYLDGDTHEITHDVGVVVGAAVGGLVFGSLATILGVYLWNKRRMQAEDGGAYQPINSSA